MLKIEVHLLCTLHSTADFVMYLSNYWRMLCNGSEYSRKYTIVFRVWWIEVKVRRLTGEERVNPWDKTNEPVSSGLRACHNKFLLVYYKYSLFDMCRLQALLDVSPWTHSWIEWKIFTSYRTCCKQFTSCGNSIVSGSFEKWQIWSTFNKIKLLRSE